MIYYVIKPSEKKKICRDVMEPYAESLGFNKITIEDAFNMDFSDKDLVIIDYCWVYDSESEVLRLCVLQDMLRGASVPCYFRLVDDNPTKYNELDWIILNHLRNQGGSLIAPYDIRYLGFLDPIVIPYHYEDADELPITAEGRSDRIILSGLINKVFYPYRTYVALNYNPIRHHIDHLDHPGYSGRFWKADGMVLGSDYIKRLAQYKIMIVTADDESEVLKFIECAEAGCIPVGYFPSSLRDQLPDHLIQDLHIDDPWDLLDRLSGQYYHYLLDHYEHLATSYRSAIKDLRSKDAILAKYEQLIR